MAPRFSRRNIRNRMPARTGPRMLKYAVRSSKPIEFIYCTCEAENRIIFAFAPNFTKGIVTAVGWSNAIVHGSTDLLFRESSSLEHCYVARKHHLNLIAIRKNQADSLEMKTR